MKVTYDPEADAAYIAIVGTIRAGDAVTQVEVDDPRLKGEIILDLDESGLLLGVEVIGAALQLRAETLTAAQRNSRTE